MKKEIFVVLSFLTLLFVSCATKDKNEIKESSNITIEESQNVLNGEKHFLKDYNPVFDNGDINVVVEIPSGTLEKWEVDKSNGNIRLEYVDDTPRIVQYLAYPGNYGMIPQTYLPKELGGDGDPLDVIVLGAASPRGSVIRCKLIGIMQMLDRGEQDDKLIAVQIGSPFYKLNSLEELTSEFNGVTEILKIWFSNYKGSGKIEVLGFEDKEIAENILDDAILAYQNK